MEALTKESLKKLPCRKMARVSLANLARIAQDSIRTIKTYEKMGDDIVHMAKTAQLGRGHGVDSDGGAMAGKLRDAWRNIPDETKSLYIGESRNLGRIAPDDNNETLGLPVYLPQYLIEYTTAIKSSLDSPAPMAITSATRLRARDKFALRLKLFGVAYSEYVGRMRKA